MSDNHTRRLKRVVVLAIALVLSIGLWLIGWQLYSGIAPQHVPGYPNSGQFKLYVLFPGLLVLVNTAVLLVCKRIPAAAIALFLVFLGLALLTFLVAFGGGM